MSKKEFLDILKQTLDGEVDHNTIEQNIKYYSDYIGSGSELEQEKSLNTLGDPRLIAKTIIESEKIAKEKGKYTSGQGYSRSKSTASGTQEEQRGSSQGNPFGKRSFFTTGVRWYHKAILIALLVLFILVLFTIGRILIGLIYVFAIPLILMLLLLALFRKR
ncbi:MAG TPA: hypothetical protein VJ888_03935 [Mobilitalea sp.]|nr:hypothetical protein [Mobilitalea sp.]